MKTILSFIQPIRSSCFAFSLIVVFSFMGIHSVAQEYTLHLQVKSLRAINSADTIYVAGNFNGWDPGAIKYQLTKSGNVYSIDIPMLKADDYEFKFTRGKWERVEVHSNGTGLGNRLIKLQSDTTVQYEIEDWQDNFSMPDKAHTASSHVHIVDTAFLIPQLNRTRKVWIYLPEGYAKAKNKKRYPVLYMFDGQNIFDEYTSGYGEWGVDECLDSLIKDGKPACIVVGVDAGPKRINEYKPYYDEKYGEGEGDQYVDFLIKTLKPYVDKHYRTLKSSDNTLIAGSSLGGLMSYYAMLSHPGVFGKAGVFSPAFWIAPQIKELTDSVGDKVNGKIFFYIGQLEGDVYVDDMKEIADSIGKKSDAIIYTVIDPDSQHNEKAWRKWFAEFYCWMMGDGFNNQVKIEK
ncbi:MAG: alpha/beta hydrolase-fold protein [Ferruginibacter sp.]